MTWTVKNSTPFLYPARFRRLTAYAPGVEGLGVTVGTNPTANGSGLPSQIPDNFATELPVDASANGRSLLSNMFIVMD